MTDVADVMIYAATCLPGSMPVETCRDHWGSLVGLRFGRRSPSAMVRPYWVRFGAPDPVPGSSSISKIAAGSRDWT